MPVGYQDTKVASATTVVDSPREERARALLAVDWHKVADDRLGRLVDLEHDHFVLRERLQQLQVEYRDFVVRIRDDPARQHISKLQIEIERMQEQLGEQAERHGRELQAEITRMQRQLHEQAQQHGRELQAETERMQGQLRAQAEQYRREYEAMEAAFLGSSCWRITRPLRATSRLCIWLAQRGRPALRALLRIRGVRGFGRLALRQFPGLHRRLYLALYHDLDGS